MKEIIPKKLITTFDKQGKVQNSILLYQIKEDKQTKRRFHTISVKAGINIKGMNRILTESKKHAEIGEKIREVKNGMG